MNTEARSSIDTLLTTLKESLAQPGRSLLPLLTSMSRFAKYSLANQFLIFAQRPDATRVQGYRAWNKAGYQVRKGEKGIAIYAPMLFTKRRDVADPETSDESAAPRLSYRVAYVFDIAQVDAIAGTEAAAVTATPADPNAHCHLEALKAFLVGHNVELGYKALAPGLLGYTDGRRITCGAGQASHVEFATLAHETTHVLLHFVRNADGTAGARPDLTTRETEAEAVTYLLCAQLGIAGTEASVEYIQSYRGTPDTLDASLERIRATAQRLSAELAAIRFDADHDPGPA
jgi:antirestriction protein ArdC